MKIPQISEISLYSKIKYLHFALNFKNRQDQAVCAIKMSIKIFPTGNTKLKSRYRVAHVDSFV